MNNIRRFIFLSILSYILLLLSNTSTTYATHVIKDTDDVYNLLVINSYHNGHRWEGHVLEGVIEAINSNDKINIALNVEYLDFKSNEDIEYRNEFIKMLEVKYANKAIDGIYAVDDEAFLTARKFILDETSEFYQMPLFFSGVNSQVALSDEEKKYITGIYERDDTNQLLGLIKDININTKQLYVIIEDSEYGKSIKREINSLVKEHMDEVKVEYIQSTYYEDIELSLSNTKFIEDSAIIVAGEYKCKTHNTYVEPGLLINTIKKYASTLIYSNDQTYIDSGIIGGCIDIGEEQGKSIVQIIKEVINGKKILEIGTRFEPIPARAINYNEIYEYDIDINDIPMYIQIRNKKFYQLLVPSGVKVLIGFIIFVIIIIISRVSRQAYIEKKKRLKQEELERLRTDYIVSMSHELRTPLNIVLNTVKVLEYKIEDNTLDSQYLSQKLSSISKNSLRLIKFVNNFIDISKSHLGFIDCTVLNEDIVDLTRTVFEALDDYCAEKDISLTFESEEKEIICAIDSGKIQRVLLNILSNAIKFTPVGGSIYGSIKKNKKDVIISIRDTGIGISKENIGNIFLKYYQADDIMTRGSEGSGIGLAICKDLVKLHDGDIMVKSEIGEGSEFIITIPIKLSDNCRNAKQLLDIEYNVKLELSDID